MITVDVDVTVVTINGKAALVFSPEIVYIEGSSATINYTLTNPPSDGYSFSQWFFNDPMMQLYDTSMSESAQTISIKHSNTHRALTYVMLTATKSVSASESMADSNNSSQIFGDPQILNSPVGP